MVDTIKGYLNLTDKDKTKIAPIINDGTLIQTEYGFIFTKNILNMKISVKFNENKEPYRLYFYGSLSRFYFGNNYQVLSKKEVLFAIKKLSTKLNLHIKRAILTRVDFNFNIEMEKNVNHYLNCLLSLPRLECHRYPNSVLFTSKYSNGLIFYDKNKESMDKSIDTFNQIPTEYKGKNILRFEMRFKSGLGRKFKTKNAMKVRHLYRLEILDLAIKYSKGYYKKIVKKELALDVTQLLHFRSGLLYYLSYYGISYLGYDTVVNNINDYSFQVKNPKVKRSKVKSQLKSIIAMGNKVALENNFIEELDNKIDKLKPKLVP